MTQAELHAALESTGLLVAYHHFAEGSGVDPPYIVYLVSDATGWGSDERNEIKRTSYLVELYTDKKDLETQAKIESLFNVRGIRFGSVEGYIDSEKLYQVVYTIEFTQKIRGL